MNKSEFVAAVADRAGLSKKDAEKAIAAVFDTVSDVLAGEDKLQITGFGTFEVRRRAARMGKNPQTGQEIEIAAAKVPAFKPGKTLKELVNE